MIASSEYSTCAICADDGLTSDMIEDIEGALYCIYCADKLCLYCGVYDHDCEKECDLACDCANCSDHASIDEVVA